MDQKIMSIAEYRRKYAKELDAIYKSNVINYELIPILTKIAHKKVIPIVELIGIDDKQTFYY